MTNKLQAAIQTELDAIKHEIIVNAIVRHIHEEWVAKFKKTGGKITKRERNELQKRLAAQGYRCTFELKVTCYYCEIFLNDTKVDWFNLYFNIHSLENTITTIDSQMRIAHQRQAKLIVEAQTTDSLTEIEPKAIVISKEITATIEKFMAETNFPAKSEVTKAAMPQANLLYEVLKMLRA